MVIYTNHWHQIYSIPQRRKPVRLLCLWIFCAIFVSAIYGCYDDGKSKPVATVDGIKITIGEYNEILAKELNMSIDRSSLTPEDYHHLKEEVLNNLIDEKVMLLRARNLSLSISDAELMKKMEEIKESYENDSFERIMEAQKINFNVWKEDLKKRMILEKVIASDVNSNITFTEQEALAYYTAHKRMYTPEKRAHVAQIVVRDREKAESILKRLKNGEDFGKVAREESIGPEAAKDGDLGFVSQGFMPEEIDAAIFSQESGEISPVIKSLYGYHIFKIIEIRAKAKITWVDIKEQVMNDLRKKKEEQAYVLWLQELRSKAIIKKDLELLEKGTPPLNNTPE